MFVLELFFSAFLISLKRLLGDLNMLLRWRQLHPTLNRLFKIPSLYSLYNSSSSMVYIPEKTLKNSDFRATSQITLNPQIVESTLLNCPSDVIALSFFLWCARQPNYFHDRHSFDRMILVAGRLTDRFKTVKGVVRGLESSGCVTKPQTFLVLVRIYWHGRMFSLVLEAFEEMISYGYTPNTFARNIIMDVFFKIRRADAALKVLRETQFPNFLTFNIAICNLCKLNDLSGVQDVSKIMLRKGFYPNRETFLMVLNCFCKGGRLAESLQVLGLMISLGIPPCVTIWSILIDGFCRAGRLGIANYLLKKMVTTGYSPNVVTYTSIIKGFMGSQMFSRAFSILNDMESRGCVPDLVLCNVLIDCLSKAGRYDDALDVFLGLPKRRLEPDSYTFCSILSTLCLSQRFALLPQLVSGLVVSADLVLFNSLVSYYCKAGFPSHAVDFYNDMVNRGFTPDGYSYVGLLSGLCGAGRIDEAVNVYHGIIMNNSNLDAHMHTAIVDGLIKAGKFHRAIKLFREAVAGKYPIDVVSYTVAIHGLVKGGRVREACTLFSQMKEFHVDPNTYTCNIMLSGLCKLGDVKMFELILRDMAYAGIEQDCFTFNTIVAFLFKLHRYRSAFNLLIEMRDLGLMPNKATYALLVNRVACAGEVGDAYHPLFKAYLEDILFVERTGSDDLPDMVASVG
ncbi:hypothetical protein HHK36_013300 [Tetracentron sinense]|uniref:Pentatricopeptide repeat-containing protein n=1 Tax=Tetracentron sinense TaxID=13715 RepID=A0A835DGG0_TETSI|nr:hypothetical protein HHK36_013300 [Tetracentron sinense]